MASSRICTIPGCNKALQADNLCAMHRWRLKKYGSASDEVLIRNSRATCAVSSCSKPAGLAQDAEGLCAHHLRRRRRSGSVDVIIADDGAPTQFLEKALNSETDECIIWPFGVAHSGYGIARIDGRAKSVHRHICELAHGPAAEGLYACHSCGIRACVNPRHLRFDTPTANSADMDKHKTRRTAKLTFEQVIEIRLSDNRSDEVCKLYGVSKSTVCRLRKATKWCGFQL